MNMLTWVAEFLSYNGSARGGLSATSDADRLFAVIMVWMGLAMIALLALLAWGL